MQIQASDRTQPVLPIEFDASKKRTHDYRRHGTTNFFAALNVGTDLDRIDTRLHHALERGSKTVPLDRHGRRYPRESPPR